MYLNGEWEEACETLRHVEMIKGAVDYPTRSLITIMAQHGYEAPSDWEGFRQLTEK